MPYIPYSRQDITDDDIQAVVTVLKSDYLTQGPVIPAFERAFAEFHQVAHAVAVSNATAGLHIACLALGVGPGSRVWTSPNSFLASANCALYCGATVDFVDIDPDSRNMSVALLEEKLVAAERNGTLPHVVIPVDFAGLPCDLRPMRVLADRYQFKLIEDASHASGASYLGKAVGSDHAHATVFSFHAVKILTTAEGGMVTTPDPMVDRQLRLLRSHGLTRDMADMEAIPEGGWCYEQQTLGFNYRMTELQAALGLSQLTRLPAMHRQRAVLADRYDSLLAELPVRRPLRLADRVSSHHLYAIEIDSIQCAIKRSALFDHMRALDIGVNVHYIPIHTQPYYRRLGFRVGDFPHSERYYSQALSIPLFPRMTMEQQDKVVDAMAEAMSSS